MKINGKIILLIALQVIVIGLGILIGWTHGQPADRQRLQYLEQCLEASLYENRAENNHTLDEFQSVVELLQRKNDLPGAVDRLNNIINSRILEHSGWTEFGDHRGLEWPNGEDEYQLILRIADFRQEHPEYQTSASCYFHRRGISYIFQEARKCQARRASTRGWNPPATTEVFTIEIVEPTNAPASEPAGPLESGL